MPKTKPEDATLAELQGEAEEIRKRLNKFRTSLSRFFVQKHEIIDLMVVAAVAQEPLLLVGPPGTAKSDLVLKFKDALGLGEGDYFEYMLTRFTEPSEIIGAIDIKELREGKYIRRKEGKLPTAVVACVGGGSNAIGAFYEFLPDAQVQLIGVEAGGRGTALGQHAARFQTKGGGVPGVLQGTYSYVLQDDAGQVSGTHSVSAGLDYASVGPEHAMLHDSGRATYVACSDEEALNATVALSRTEGIVPALETAHAVAEAMRLAKMMAKTDVLMVNLSGRGDKDMGILAKELDLRGA